MSVSVMWDNFEDGNYDIRIGQDVIRIPAVGFKNVYTSYSARGGIDALYERVLQFSEFECIILGITKQKGETDNGF